MAEQEQVEFEESSLSMDDGFRFAIGFCAGVSLYGVFWVFAVLIVVRAWYGA